MQNESYGCGHSAKQWSFFTTQLTTGNYNKRGKNLSTMHSALLLILMTKISDHLPGKPPSQATTIISWV